jgi:hypothetical protein
MGLRDSVRALGGQVAQQQAATTALAFAQGSVQSVSAGVLTVLVLGNTVQAPYYGALPAIGDTVDVLLIEGSPRILGVPHGVPPTIPTN